MTEISKMLCELRRLRGFSVDQLIFNIGVPAQTYVSWEEGLSTPSLEDIVKIAKRYGVPCDLVFGVIVFTDVWKEMLIATQGMHKLFDERGCGCGVSIKTMHFVEGEKYGVWGYCPECKKAKFFSNDPNLIEEECGIKKVEAVTCANT